MIEIGLTKNFIYLSFKFEDFPISLNRSGDFPLKKMNIV